MDNKRLNLMAAFLLSFFCAFFSSTALAVELKPGQLTPNKAPVLHKLELSPEQFSRLAKLKLKPPRLSSKERRLLRKISYDVSANRLDQGKKRWEQLMVSMGSKKSLVQEDVMTVLFHVFKQSISDINEDIQYFNKKLKMYEELGDAMSDYVKELNEKMNIYEKEQEVNELKGDRKKDIVVKIITCMPTRNAKNMKLKYSYQKFKQRKLEKYIKEMEDKLQDIGEDAQLTNVDMQNMLEKQQKMMNMMSDMSKSMHDIAMSVIKNIGK